MGDFSLGWNYAGMNGASSHSGAGYGGSSSGGSLVSSSGRLAGEAGGVGRASYAPHSALPDPATGGSARVLVTQKDLRLRQLKKLRKVEMDAICRECGIDGGGLKGDLHYRIAQHVDNLCQMLLTSPSASYQESLTTLLGSIARAHDRLISGVKGRTAQPYSGGARMGVPATLPPPGGTSQDFRTNGGGGGGGGFEGYGSGFGSVGGTGGSGASGSGGSSSGGSRGVYKAEPQSEAPAASVGISDADLLQRFSRNPFIRALTTVRGPIWLRSAGSNSGRQMAAATFSLAQQQLQRMLDSGAAPRSKAGSLRLLLQCIKVGGCGGGSGGGASGGESGKASGGKSGEEDWQLWPAETVVHVNGMWTQLKQRRIFLQGPARKLKGDCDPVDIAQMCRAGQNKIDVSCADTDPGYVMVLQMVQNVGVEEVMDGIVARPRDTVEEGRERVRRSFRGQPLDGSGVAVAVAAAKSGGSDSGGGGGTSASSVRRKEGAAGSDDSDSDDELTATSTRLSLRCPLGLVPIRVPARGRRCGHLQCFDLSTFLIFSERSSAAWRCGVCHLLILPADMVVDAFLMDVVRTLGERVADVEEVEIFPDGRWEPIDPDSKPAAGSRCGPAARRSGAAARGGAGGASSGGGGVSSGSSGGAAGDSAAVSRLPVSPRVLLNLGDFGSAVDNGGVGNGGGGRGSGSGFGVGAAAGGASAAGAASGVVDLSLSDDDEDEVDNGGSGVLPPAAAAVAGAASAAAVAGAASAAATGQQRSVRARQYSGSAGGGAARAADYTSDNGSARSGGAAGAGRGSGGYGIVATSSAAGMHQPRGAAAPAGAAAGAAPSQPAQRDPREPGAKRPYQTADWFGSGDGGGYSGGGGYVNGGGCYANGSASGTDAPVPKRRRGVGYGYTRGTGAASQPPEVAGGWPYGDGGGVGGGAGGGGGGDEDNSDHFYEDNSDFLQSLFAVDQGNR